MNQKCKITVICRPFFSDISKMSYGKEIGARDGIKSYVYTALRGGTIIGMDKYITCCPNGIHPVIFKIDLDK